MAVPTNTVTEHAVIGTREDLSDIISNIAPTETPFYSGIGRGKATQVFHEHQTDSLDAAATNTAVEGDDPTAEALTPTVRIGNYCQISEKTVIVSGTSRASDQAGRADELSYQVARRGRELKRDIEFALTRNQASSAGNASTARTAAGLESWLATNKVSNGTGTAQTTAGFASGLVAAPVDSTVAGAFTKASLDSVIKQCWEQGGSPDVLMVGPHNRTVISGFTGISTLQTDANTTASTMLVGSIDLYKSNFGNFKVLPNRFQRDQTAFVLDMEMFKFVTLRPMQMNPLAKTGDNEKRQMLCEFTLASMNELASGKVTDLTVA